MFVLFMHEKIANMQLWSFDAYAYKLQIYNFGRYRVKHMYHTSLYLTLYMPKIELGVCVYITKLILQLICGLL